MHSSILKMEDCDSWCPTQSGDIQVQIKHLHKNRWMEIPQLINCPVMNSNNRTCECEAAHHLSQY